MSFQEWSETRLLVFAAFMAVFAALFQAMGSLSGIGFFISPLATAPIFLITIISKGFGFLAYFVAIFILLLLRPDELFVFPFTTGLIGLSFGITFPYIRKNLLLAVTNGVVLMFGIFLILYVLKFPILGPTLGKSFDLLFVGGSFAFTFIYCLLWTFICRFLLKKLKGLKYF